MSQIFRRAYRLVVGDLDLSNLAISFSVKKSLKPAPNVCEIRIRNLSQDHRNLLATPKSLPVRLEAGYVGALATLYLGEMRSVQSTIEGPTVVTELTSADSEDPHRKAKMNVPISGKSPAEVLQLMVQGFGVGPGNAAQMAGNLRKRGFADVYGKRAVISGHLRNELNDFCKSAGIEWSVQDGKFQFLDLNKPLEGQAVELSAETGLVGSPTVDNKGLASATSLLQPLLVPGRKVSFQAVNLKGGYRIINVEYTGDTASQEWYAKLQCRKY